MNRKVTLACISLIAVAAFSAPVLASEEVLESRIYGGKAVESCEWPTAIGFGTCSGTLVHPQIVIYAAHCGIQHKISFGDAYRTMKRTVKPKFCMKNPAYKNTKSLSTGVDFAYCYLEEPINDFPIAPIAYGCELDQIKAGTKIWLVGYGNTETGKYGTKHKVETEIKGIIAKGNELKVGGGGKATCNGDSGGPGYVQLSDGTWRHVAISSYGFGECGQPSGMTFSQAAVPWIHESLKSKGIDNVDLTPCYDDEGKWAPTEACKGFATEPGKAHGGWDEQCGGKKAPRSGYSSICGPAFGENDAGQGDDQGDGSKDEDGKDKGPEISWVSPKADTQIKEGESLTVQVEVSGKGNELSVTLLVDGKKQDQLDASPYEWTVEDLDRGEHALVAIANDGKKKTKTDVRAIEVVEASSAEDGDVEDEDTESAGSSEKDEDSGGQDDDGKKKKGGCSVVVSHRPGWFFAGFLRLSGWLRRRRTVRAQARL